MLMFVAVSLPSVNELIFAQDKEREGIKAPHVYPSAKCIREYLSESQAAVINMAFKEINPTKINL